MNVGHGGTGSGRNNHVRILFSLTLSPIIDVLDGKFGSGFRPSPFMTSGGPNSGDTVCLPTPLCLLSWLGSPSQQNTVIITNRISSWRTLLSSRLLFFVTTSRDSIVPGLWPWSVPAKDKTEGEDIRLSSIAFYFISSFSTVPGSIESDLRTLYCAFAISNMLNDWSGVDINSAVAFIARCRVSYSSQFISNLICYFRLMKAVMVNLHVVKPKVTSASPFCQSLTPNRGNNIHCCRLPCLGIIRD